MSKNSTSSDSEPPSTYNISMEQGKVYVVIVNYNAWEVVRECLDSLLESTYWNFEIVLVDNSEKHLEFAKYTKDLENDRITFIESEKNLGFAGGCNVGTKYVQQQGNYDYIWYLNPDTVVDAQALEKLIEKDLFYQTNSSKVGMIGSKQMIYDDPKEIHSLYKVSDNEHNIVHVTDEDSLSEGVLNGTEFVQYLTGSAMLVRREFIEDIGLMDEEWFLNFEEIDWQQKGSQKGWKIGLAIGSVIHHRVSYSIDSFNDGYYMTRNHLYFVQKYFPKDVIKVLLGKIFSINLLRAIIRLRWRWLKGFIFGVSDFYKKKRGRL